MESAGHTRSDGTKSETAPANWPFGRVAVVVSESQASQAQELAQAVATSIKKGRRKVKEKVNLSDIPEALM